MEYNDKLAELTQRQAELEHQVATYRGELARLDAQQFIDPGKYNGVKSELDYAQTKLDAVNAEIAELTGAAETAQEDLFDQFDNIEVAGISFSLRDLAKGPDQYQMISAFFQKHVGDLAQRHAVVVSSYKSQVEQMETETAELNNVRRLNYELSDKLVDMEQRRDAAADELKQALDENKRLQEDNRSLRQQIEASTQPKQTNVSESAAEIARKLHEAKPGIYNKRWKSDIGRTHYLAELAETGETIEIPYLQLGKYREVSAEEANRFRLEKEAERSELERLAQEVVEHIEAPSLPYEDAGVSTEPVTGEVVSEAVTRCEFDKLAARVAQLEQQNSLKEVA